MKKLLTLFLALVVVFVMCSCGGSDNDGKVVFTTGGTTGVYYIYGGELTSVLMNNVEGLNITVNSSGGSKDNVLALYQGDAQLGFVQNDVMSYAYAGDDFFDNTVADNFKAIAALYPEICQVVVAKDAGIETIADLKGKNVSVGPAGSGHYFNAMQMLETAGLTVDDVNAQYLDNTEVIEAFQNKKIDAFFLTAAYPHATVTDCSMKRDIDFITFSDDEIASLQEKYSFFVTDTIPAGTYEGVDRDITAPAVSAVLVASDDLDEETVYNITKALFENKDSLTNAKKEYINPEYAVSGIPTTQGDQEDGVTIGSFHPGALKYYKEIGVIAE